MSREVGEESEGEWVLREVAIEEKVEKIFFEAEKNSGLKSRRRGILPVLVIQMLNWLVSFPMMPLVVRSPFAKKLCSFSPRVEKAWRSGSCSFQAFKRLVKAVIHSRSGINISNLKKGCRVFGRFSFGSGQDYVEKWIQWYGLDELIDRIRHRDWN